MYKFSLSLVLLIISCSLSAQLSKDIFPLNRQFKNGGFFIEPQATFSVGNSIQDEIKRNDSLYTYDEDGKGKWGYGLELGWFHSFEKPRLVHYIEFAAAYRLLQGEVEHKGTLENLSSKQSFESKNNFKNQYLSASFRAVNATQLGDFSYLSTALGINYNYLLDSKYEREVEHPNFGEKFHNEHSLQVHLKIGIGLRLSRQLIAVPSIETPLLSLYPTDDLNPAFPFYNSKFHPVYIGIKLMFLREDPFNCNAPIYEGPVN